MRSEFMGADRSDVTDRWFVKFTMFKGEPDKEYVSGEITSGAVFPTRESAEYGARRALKTLAETGKFPNMCAIF